MISVFNPQYPNGLVPDEFESFGEKRFIKFVKEQVALEKMFPKKFKEVQDKIIKFYLHQDKTAKKDYVFYLRKYAQVSLYYETQKKNSFNLSNTYCHHAV